MPINPFTLKQMKDGTLYSLKLQGQPLDEKDYRTINNFLRTTQTLREFDLSYMGGGLEQFADALKQNRSVTKLGLSQVVQDHNVGVLIDILKNNPGISELNLTNCYMQGGGVSQLARAIKANPHITHIDMEGVNRDHTGSSNVETVIRVMKDNPNILSFSPETDDTDRICAANESAARRLLASALKSPEKLDAAAIDAIRTRLPAIIHIAEAGGVGSRKELVQLLINIEDAAGVAGAAFAIPERFAATASELPRPFQASDKKVDFAELSTGQLHKPAGQPRIYQAVEAGQVEELMAYLKKEGLRLTAEDCLAKPEGKRENLIQLVARQGKLASVMNEATWLGDPRGLKTAAEAVPAREWKRQMKDLPAERLIFQVNAASFKQARKSQAKGPG